MFSSDVFPIRKASMTLGCSVYGRYYALSNDFLLLLLLKSQYLIFLADCKCKLAEYLELSKYTNRQSYLISNLNAQFTLKLSHSSRYVFDNLVDTLDASTLKAAIHRTIKFMLDL